MTQLYAGSQTRTGTPFLARDFKSEQSASSDNDLAPDHSGERPPSSATVHPYKEGTVTQPVTRDVLRAQPAFPSQIFVTLNSDNQNSETLEAAFFPEDCEEGQVAVYELRSVGKLERRFVHQDREYVGSGSTLEQQRAYSEVGQ